MSKTRLSFSQIPLYKKFLYLTVLTSLLGFGTFAFSAYSESQNQSPENALTDSDAPNMAKQPEKKGCCGGEALAANEFYTLLGTYYSLKDGQTSVLMFNNKAPEPLAVNPTFFSSDGERLDLSPLIIPPMAYQEFNVRDLLTDNNLPEFEEGNLQITHQGAKLQLGVQIKILMPDKGIIFDEQFAQTSRFVSSRLENVWWLPSPQAETKVVFSNTTDSEITATVKVSGVSPQQREPATIRLNPHQTRTVDIMQDLAGQQASIIHKEGGISITHTGSPGALLARMMVANKNNGFSSVANFIDPKATASSRWNGSGYRIGMVGNEKLTPVVVARNVGDSSSLVSGRISYTDAAGEVVFVEVPAVQIGAGKIKTINIADAIFQNNVPANITDTGFEFEYSTPKGSIVMAALSMSSGGNQVFQVPLYDPGRTPSSAGGYPWKAVGDYSTILYIKNDTDQTQKYTASLIYEGGSYALGVKELKPRQLAAIDFRELRDKQTPGANKTVIPLNLERGQISWSSYGGTNHVLSGRSHQSSISEGVSSTYDCRNCCPDNVIYYYVVPLLTTVGFGEHVNYFAAGETESCYAFAQFQNFPLTGWSSSDTSVATIDYYGGAEAVSGGDALQSVEWNSYEWEYIIPTGECARTDTPGQGAGTMEVKPPIEKIQYNVNGTWTDIPSGGIGPICKGTSVNFRAIAQNGASFPSGYPTWGGDAAGTGQDKSVTFNNSGGRTISATSANTISVNVTVGETNNAINITWLSPSITTSSSSANPTTTDKPFSPTYTACANLGDNTWNLRVKKMEGGTNITIYTGGYRNPDNTPPINQTEATDAINTMNDYYNNGRGSWHSPAASEAHEKYHDSEWQCSSNHYWAQTETAMELLTEPYTSYNSEAAAVNQLRTKTNGADTKLTNFTTAAQNYWGSLDDSAPSRPYAAGQLILNTKIQNIIQLANNNSWTVPGVANASPNTANPCYKTFPGFTP